MPIDDYVEVIKIIEDIMDYDFYTCEIYSTYIAVCYYDIDYILYKKNGIINIEVKLKTKITNSFKRYIKNMFKDDKFHIEIKDSDMHV